MTHPKIKKSRLPSSHMRQTVGSKEEAIMDCAERLFAEHGYDNVSLRWISKELDVNLASVNYYFGSKLGLLRAVLHRRAGPINDERSRLLRQCEQKFDAGSVTVEEVLRSFMEPTMRGEGGHYYRGIRRHLATSPDPTLRGLFDEAFYDVAKQFIVLLRKIVPTLREEEFMWRVACVYSAMLFLPPDHAWLPKDLASGYERSDVDSVMRHAIPFLVAGMSLPSVEQ